jgi:hypothetical protein
VTSDEVSYVLVTDDPEMRVPGWHTHVIDNDQYKSTRAANRYFKMLPHRAFPEFDYSLYIDGNIRLLSDVKPVFDEFIASKACLGLFPHPLRNSVKEEVEACLQAGKVVDNDNLQRELAHYRQERFPDNVGLIEASVILKNHRHPGLDRAMEAWWHMFERFETRDQFSLPFVLWKTKVACMLQSFSFRDQNPYFGVYTHRKDTRAPKYYGYVQGRAFDSIFYAALLKMWHLSWTIRRSFRPS